MRHVYQILIELSKIQILNFRQKVNNYKNKLTNNQRAVYILVCNTVTLNLLIIQLFQSKHRG